MAIKLYNNNTLQVSGLQVKNNTTGQTVVFASNEALQDYCKAQMFIATVLQVCDCDEHLRIVAAVQLQMYKKYTYLSWVADELQELQRNYDDNLLGDVAAVIEKHSVAFA